MNFYKDALFKDNMVFSSKDLHKKKGEFKFISLKDNEWNISQLWFVENGGKMYLMEEDTKKVKKGEK